MRSFGFGLVVNSRAMPGACSGSETTHIGPCALVSDRNPQHWSLPNGHVHGRFHVSDHHAGRPGTETSGLNAAIPMLMWRPPM